MNWWATFSETLFPSQSTTPDSMPGLFPGDLETSASLSSTRRRSFASILSMVLVSSTSVFILVLGFFLSFLSRFFYSFEPRERSLSRSGTSFNNALMNDPIRRAEQFMRDLEENLLPLQQFALCHSDLNAPNLPPFFEGSYTQALYMATHRAKFLFVYLTNTENDGALSLFQGIITNPKFISIFSTNPDQNIIWGGDLASPEAYQLANSLNISKFPTLGLICLTRTTTMTPEGPVKGPPRISLISKIQGGLKKDQNPDHIISNKFIKRMMKYEQELAVIRTTLREKYINDSLRRKQESDYKKALEKDRQKKLEKERKLLVSKYLAWRQPYFLRLLHETDHSGTAKIAIKLREGHRLTVFFPRESPVQDVLTLVELQTRGMLDDINYTEDSSPDYPPGFFDGLKMDHDFKLVSTVPPRLVLNDEVLTKAIGEIDYLYPRGLLMVESR